MKQVDASAEALLKIVRDKGEVRFTHEPMPRGRHTIVTSSCVDPSSQPQFHALAVAGLLAQSMRGDTNSMSTTVVYQLTALGRDALGIHRQEPRSVHRTRYATDEELEREGIE